MSAYNEFIECFREVVGRCTRAVAVCEEDGRILTYKELWERSVRLSEVLVGLGCGPGVSVGLHLERSTEYVVGLIGVWMSGAAFVPIDPELPEKRKEFIVNDCNAACVLSMEGDLNFLDGSADVSFCEGIFVNWLFGYKSNGNCENSLAYVIYTSGSSGKPKGVMVSHAGIVPMLRAQIEVFSLCEKSRLLWMHGVGFDASVSDIGTALLSGAMLCMAPGFRFGDLQEFLHLMDKMEITHIDIAPSLLALIDPCKAPVKLQTIVIGGEACRLEVVREWAEQKRVVNVYGPTEATVCTSMAVCSSDWDRPYLGEPVPGVSYSVRSANGKTVSLGIAGELYIRGDAVALGYLKEKQLSEERFFVEDGERVFRSGDRVVEHSDKRIEFLGRIDRQVKLNGKLVCPEEIECVLVAHRKVKQAIVLSFNGCMCVALHLHCAVESEKDMISILREYAAEVLPTWMIPVQWRFVDSFPLTGSGKIDVPKVAQLFEMSQTDGLGLDKMDSLEEQILRLFTEVIGRNSLGRNDDFFYSGGDSLSVIRLLSKAMDVGLLLSAESVYRGRSAAGLAVELRSEQGMEAVSCKALCKEVAYGGKWKSMLNKAALRSDSSCDVGDPHSIFFTGATGFLGSCVIGELLKQTRAKIYCLGRGSSDVILERIAAGVRRHGFDISNGEMERLVPVEGDLAIAGFGVCDNLMNHLVEEVDTVFHLAADISIVAPFENLKEANVGGTQRVIEFLCRGRKKRFHYASTLAVLVDALPKPVVCMENDRLENMESVFGGYAQSKWSAEKMIHETQGKAGPTSVFRFGLLTGNSKTQFVAHRDWLSMFIRGLDRIELPVKVERERLFFDFTPVDFAAAAMVHLALHSAPKKGVDVFHVANEFSVSLDDLAKALENFDDFEESGAELSAIDAVGDLGLSHTMERLQNLHLFKATGTRFSMERTIDGLHGPGISCPEINAQYLKEYIASVRNQTMGKV